MVSNFFKITCKRILKSRKFLCILIFLLILPLIVLLMNDWSVDSNNWNGLFFIFGNRYLYFLFIMPVFLIFLYDLANEGNLRYCAGRLLTKATIIKVQIKTMILYGFFLTIYVFVVVIIEAILILGGTFAWSNETAFGLDPYTFFPLELSPMLISSFFAIKFFMTIIFLGSFYLYWQSITKRQSSRLGVSIMFFLLLFNAIVNFHHIPFLNILDLSFVNIYYLNPQDNSILFQLFRSQAPLSLLSIGLLFLALRLSKGVNL
ncbi:hypothetical protein [Lysinibacillus sp. C5.1]|uniref:hypothetical protein n=1 Tax=Lysinibacillus sp. C5.1 TaxID=2796169 RepID=UPI0030819700